MEWHNKLLAVLFDIESGNSLMSDGQNITRTNIDLLSIRFLEKKHII